MARLGSRWHLRRHLHRRSPLHRMVALHLLHRGVHRNHIACRVVQRPKTIWLTETVQRRWRTKVSSGSIAHACSGWIESARDAGASIMQVMMRRRVLCNRMRKTI